VGEAQIAVISRSKSRSDNKRLLQIHEYRIAALLNIVVVLAVAAVAYTDWVVVVNVSLGYLYILPIALCALVNPVPLTVTLTLICTFLQDLFGPAADSLALRIAHNGIDLIGFLVVGFLVTQIAKQQNRLAEEVRRQRDEFERDLVLAAQVQRQVLPKPATFPGLEVAATMQTARLLGGDYYDFFQISDDVVDVVIADVSGKGVAAALLMPSLAVALRLRARELSGPAEIMKDLDGVLRQITNPATFVTMFYARFKRATRTLEYSSGGHNPPILIRPTTGESRLLEGAGPILGILPDAQFSSTEIPLHPGDILALYTDGVTEQENEGGEEFSADRLNELIVRKENEPATALVADISETVFTFAGTKEQADDLTVLVVKVL
jgi:sigma-B regulation protein RsbU (phosphoserine phosphatase)